MLNFKPTLILYAVVLILGGIIAALEIKGETEVPDDKYRIFGGYEAADFREISIIRDPKHKEDAKIISLKKTGDNWYIHEPIRWMAQESMVNKLLKLLTEDSDYSDRYDRDFDKAAYKFDESPLVFKCKLANGEGVELRFGLDVDDDKISALWVEKNRLYVVQKRIWKNYLDYRGKQFINMKLAEINPNRVLSVGMKRKGTDENFAISRKDTDPSSLWSIDSSRGERASTPDVNKLLAALGGSIYIFPSDENSQSPDKNGLGEPELTIDVTEEGDIRHKILIGNRSEWPGADGKKIQLFYARNADFPAVAAISESVLDQIGIKRSISSAIFPENPFPDLQDALRDRLYVYREPDWGLYTFINITNNYTLDGQTVKIDLVDAELEGQRYRKYVMHVDENPMEIDTYAPALNELDDALASMQALEFHENNAANRAKFGLEDKCIEITLTYEKMAQNFTYRLKPDLGTATMYICETGNPFIIKTSDELYTLLEKAEQNFRQRLFWKPFQPEWIKEFEINMNNDYWLLVQENDQWFIKKNNDTDMNVPMGTTGEAEVWKRLAEMMKKEGLQVAVPFKVSLAMRFTLHTLIELGMKPFAIKYVGTYQNDDEKWGFNRPIRLRLKIKPEGSETEEVRELIIGDQAPMNDQMQKNHYARVLGDSNVFTYHEGFVMDLPKLTSTFRDFLKEQGGKKEGE